RELDARAGANRTDVLDASAQFVEQWPRPVDVVYGTADEAEELAFLRGTDGAADGTFDQRRTARRDLRSERLLDLRTHGAHFDEELASDVTRQQPFSGVIRPVDRRRVGERGDDHVRGAREFASAAGNAHAGCRKRASLPRCAVPHRARVTTR